MSKQLMKFLTAQTKHLALLSLGLSLFACGNKQQMNTNQVGEYAVTTLQTTSKELVNTYPATIKGKQDIEIRPNVSGFITRLCVDEGSVVRQGQTLFVIDPVPYQAALKVAEANVNVARTTVATNQLTYDNKKQLHQKGIISDYELQVAANTLATAKAQLSQAQAQLVNARNNLSYTNVKSPSNGVVGTIPYRVGSLVSSAITTPLTVVSNIDQMYVYFAMTEKQLLDMTRESGSLNSAIKTFPEVGLKLADGSEYGEKGKVTTISGVIDQTTGSVTIRADFKNAQHLLKSGGIGTILIPYVNNAAILIPQTAATELQNKKYVYTVGSDNKVKFTEITVSTLDDGQTYLVLSGVKAGDRIVTQGVAALQDGMTIKPISEQEAAAKVQQATQMGAAQGMKMKR
jgi:RND family efflux transporter MFP subunit